MQIIRRIIKIINRKRKKNFFDKFLIVLIGEYELEYVSEDEKTHSNFGISDLPLYGQRLRGTAPGR